MTIAHGLQLLLKSAILIDKSFNLFVVILFEIKEHVADCLGVADNILQSFNLMLQVFDLRLVLSDLVCKRDWPVDVKITAVNSKWISI